jgi:methylenetetrahydrofolate dehydrogenase (NADP+)/methenyltetrahydrofolate cyclohydrolase
MDKLNLTALLLSGRGVHLTATIIDGTIVAESIRAELRGRIAALRTKGIVPGLAVILVGDDPASATYVRMKGKACEELGIRSETIVRPGNLSERDLLAEIDRLNLDPGTHGILVQLPLPRHIDPNLVMERIDPRKDVDCFHPINVGRILIGEGEGFQPATPSGVQELLLRSGNDPAGKHVVICGRSNIVGKPLAAMLMQKRPGADATVTLCHSRTNDLASLTRQADILISAMGIPRFIKADMVKAGAVVIDVGTSRVEDPSHPKGSRLVGDVDFEAVREKAKAITPVPKGVGPMTIVMLMRNTVLAAERSMSR